MDTRKLSAECNEKSNQAISRRKPALPFWGFLSSPSGYTGYFYWFHTYREMCDYLAQCWLWEVGDLGTTAKKKRLPLTAEAVQLYEAGDLPAEAFLEKMSRLADEICLLDWIGTFEDLLQGEDDFTFELREDFRSWNNSSSRGRDAISPEEMDAFCEFIRLCRE